MPNLVQMSHGVTLLLEELHLQGEHISSHLLHKLHVDLNVQKVNNVHLVSISKTSKSANKCIKLNISTPISSNRKKIQPERMHMNDFTKSTVVAK